MKYYMMVEPLIKNEYWCTRYNDGIKKEIKSNKGTLIEVTFAQLQQLKDYTRAQKLRPVLIVNCITHQWIFDCITHLKQQQIHPLLIAPYNTVPSIPCSTVSFDFTNAFYNLGQYLYESGHKRIALLGINPDSINDITKKNTFSMFARDYKIGDPDTSIFWNKGNLEKCCLEFYSHIDRFDAVLCSNDIVAVKLINFLKTHNIDVPKDMYIAAMGNTVLSSLITPDITISELNCEQIGCQAVKLNTLLAKNPDISSLSATVGGRILPRKSTDFFPAPDSFQFKGERIGAQNINFYSDADVNRIFCIERLVSGCDDLDKKILHGLICNKNIIRLADELFTTENTVKYRIRRMQTLTNTNSRKELTELFTKILY